MVSAVAFALSEGEPADPRRRLFADALPRSSHDHDRRLLVTVEPLEPSRRGMEVAASALTALRLAFEAATDEAVTLALVRAMAAADAAVDAENRSSPSEERDRRVMIGATAVVIEGMSMTVAQLPPSQAMLIQDGLAYGLPALASWSPAFVADGDETLAEPLGAGTGVAPLLYRTSLSPGDLILLCDSTLARCLDEKEQTGDDGARSKLRTLDDALQWLENVAARNDLDEVQAACVAISARLDARDPYAHLTSVKRGPRWLKVSNQQRSRHHAFRSTPKLVPEPDEAPPALASDEAVAVASVDVAPEPPPSPSVEEHVESTDSETGPEEEDAAQFEDEEDCAVVTSESVSDQEQEQYPTSSHSIDTGSDADTAPVPIIAGARQFRTAAVEPAPWWQIPDRQRLNRLGKPRVLIVALAALVAICATTGLWHSRSVARGEQSGLLVRSLAAVDATLAQAAQGSATTSDLAAANIALQRAEELGAAGAVVQNRRTLLSNYQDAQDGIVRLGGVSRIGGLPAELAGGERGGPRLVRANRDLYLVAGGFYRLDLAENILVPVLTPGSEVGDHVVGSLNAGAWAPGGLSVTDGAAVFTVDASDSWTVQPLGTTNESAQDGAPCATLNGAFYLLNEPTGQILKYDLANPSSTGETWLAASEAAPLQNARGMVIDGEVHVLLADGRLATLADGAVNGIRDVRVEPSLTDPVAITGGMDASALWILDQANNEPRLTRVDPDGGEAKSFRLAAPAGMSLDTAFASLHDVAVDEVGHVAYFLTDTAIWRADLPVFLPVE